MTPFSPLPLPNGSTLHNRIAKAAMEENMANARQAPSPRLLRLYQTWAQGGAGLLISGNVMIDRRAMTGAAGVVLEDDRELDAFKRWAAAGRSGGGQFWLQLNHPGRQVPANLGQVTLAPSALPLQLGALSRHFGVPRAMDAADIQQVIQRFAHSARLAETAGFDGVQIHAAHGYLLSQFLSPLSNRRDDDWGGPLRNRARLLLQVVAAVRAAVSPGFAVAVKLNSADFQRGGFNEHDARQVVHLLNAQAVDLVELSGGSYEAPAMSGQARDGRTLAREAYFLELAAGIRTVAHMPVMVTGGIRRLPVAQQVIDGGVDVVGIASALALDPQLPQRWQRGEASHPGLAPLRWKNKPLAALATMAAIRQQLRRVGRGRPTQRRVCPLPVVLLDRLSNALRVRRYRRLMARLPKQH